MSDNYDTGTHCDRLLQTLESLLGITNPVLDGALREASDLIGRVVGADKVDIFLYDDDSDCLVAKGVSDTSLGAKQKAHSLHRLAVANGGRAVEVFQTGVSRNNGRVDQDLEEVKGIRD